MVTRKVMLRAIAPVEYPLFESSTGNPMLRIVLTIVSDPDAVDDESWERREASWPASLHEKAIVNTIKSLQMLGAVDDTDLSGIDANECEGEVEQVGKYLNVKWVGHQVAGAAPASGAKAEELLAKIRAAKDKAGIAPTTPKAVVPF
jgi:hypothetical protein